MQIPVTLWISLIFPISPPGVVYHSPSSSPISIDSLKLIMPISTYLTIIQILHSKLIYLKAIIPSVGCLVSSE